MTCCVTRTDGATPGGSAPIAEQGARIIALNATPTGAVDDSVARYNPASPTQIGSVPLANWLTFTTTANEGTTWKITQPGVYYCTMIQTPAAVGVAGLLIGITLDAPAAMLNGNPQFYAAGGECFATDFLLNEAAGTFYALQCGGPVTITSAMAANAALGIIRAHITDLFGGPPVALTYNAAESTFRILRIGDAA